MIIIDDVDIYIIEVVDMNGLYGEGESLVVAYCAGRKVFIGVTKESTIHLEYTEGEGICVVFGIPVG